MKRISAFFLGALAALSLSVFAAQQTINIGSAPNDGRGHVRVRVLSLD